MSEYNSILLCSDLDGTLALQKQISDNNVAAINKFMREGGLFTICTGRTHHYLSEIFKKVTPNTFIISLNGAVIIDHKSGKCLYKGYLSDNYVEAVNRIVKYIDYLDVILIYYDEATMPEEISPKDYLLGKTSFDKSRKVHKIVSVFTDEYMAEKAQTDVSLEFKETFECVRSWPTGLELLDINSTKGNAVKRLKEYTKANTLICAGDYENDISMIKAADIGYAVSGGSPKLIAAADRISVPFAQDAIASIIDEIKVLPQIRF